MNAERAAKTRAAPEPIRESDPPPLARLRGRDNAPEPVDQTTEAERPTKLDVSKTADTPALSETFDKAADPVQQPQAEADIPRSEELRRLMEEWRRNNPGRDFGREL